MITADTIDAIRTTVADNLEAARLAFGEAIAEAFIAERDAAGRTAPEHRAPRQPQFNRRQRRQLAALARKRRS